jgi:hypothetical protein
MKEQIALALLTKEQARLVREKDPSEAMKLVQQATSQLDNLWEERRATIDAAGAGASPDERDLVEALAETHGVSGGIFRSAGRFKDAVREYERGLVFEQHAARKVDNSYNLVQRLLNCVLVAPKLAGAPEWKVESTDGKSIDMWRGLESAAGELERQTTTSRVRDPWAAADKIIVQILLSPRTGKEAQRLIQEALAKFESLRPKPFCYDSTLRTLNDVKRSLGQIPKSESTEEALVISGHLDDVIKKLNKGFARARAR